MEQLIQICKEALHRAHTAIASLGEAGVSEVHDEHVVDIATKGDRSVSEELISFFKGKGIPAVLESEESGTVELTKNPKYRICFDDIDGTDNYHRGRTVLPYCTVVTILGSINPYFEDVLVAGIIEHNSGHLWHAVKNEGCYLDDVKVKTSGNKTLNRRTLVIIDHYIAGEDISKFLKIYPVSWVKDFGTAAFHLAGISSGLFDAYLSYFQKAHELGAGYRLIKEARGFLEDWSGKPLDKVKYDFNAKYPVVAASTEELGKMLLSKLK